MKTLILMRHANAEARENDQLDAERPLTRKGKKAARKTGKVMSQHAVLPQRIVSSSARRTSETAKEVSRKLTTAPKIDLLDTLYLATPHAFVDVLREMADELDCVMVVGHNPGLREFLQALTGTVLRFPKATAAYIHLPIDSWQQISLESRGELDTLITLE
jgi:phosphohistidine phosphatase